MLNHKNQTKFLSSNSNQSKRPLQSNTAAKQSKSRAKKRSNPSSNTTSTAGLRLSRSSQDDAQSKSMDSLGFHSSSITLQPIHHPGDNDILDEPPSKRTPTLHHMKNNQSKTLQASTPSEAIGDSVSAGLVLSPLFIPDADVLREACKELEIVFNLAAYEYWPKMKISSIPSKVVSFETYPTQHIDGFKLLSMFLTGSESQ